MNKTEIQSLLPKKKEQNKPKHTYIFCFARESLPYWTLPMFLVCSVLLWAKEFELLLCVTLVQATRNSYFAAIDIRVVGTSARFLGLWLPKPRFSALGGITMRIQLQRYYFPQGVFWMRSSVGFGACIPQASQPITFYKVLIYLSLSPSVSVCMFELNQRSTSIKPFAKELLKRKTLQYPLFLPKMWSTWVKLGRDWMFEKDSPEIICSRNNLPCGKHWKTWNFTMKPTGLLSPYPLFLSPFVSMLNSVAFLLLDHLCFPHHTSRKLISLQDSAPKRH